MVADSLHFEEEQDPDLDPHKSDADPLLFPDMHLKGWIRISITGMRIRNPERIYPLAGLDNKNG